MQVFHKHMDDRKMKPQYFKHKHFSKLKNLSFTAFWGTFYKKTLLKNLLSTFRVRSSDSKAWKEVWYKKNLPMKFITFPELLIIEKYAKIRFENRR